MFLHKHGPHTYIYTHLFTHMVLTDRDECSGVNDCHQLCINTIGSFECDCFERFQLDPADNVTCTGKYSIHNKSSRHELYIVCSDNQVVIELV